MVRGKEIIGGDMGRMIKKKKQKKYKAQVATIPLIELNAFHEAGHAVIDIICGIPFGTISISGNELTGTQGIVDTATAVTTQPMVIMAYLAGQIATDIRSERTPFLRVTDESKNDYELAFSVANGYCFSRDETLKFMYWCHARATNLIKANWDSVERLARLLLNDHRIGYEEAKAIVLKPESTAPEAQGSTNGNG